MTQRKKMLPVKPGETGLRQSDAVFAHIKAMGAIMEELFERHGKIPALDAVGVSVTPSNAEGSYMPCFLAGEMAARSIAASHGCAVKTFSHQEGHIAAALYGTGSLGMLKKTFLAFHISGGTTDCVLVSPGNAKGFDISLICKSLDLHAGQAVDRVGAMLGLSFPAGPSLEKLALESGERYTPKPALKGADCCLSGIENQCRAMLQKGSAPADIARYCIDYLARTILEMALLSANKHPGLPFVFAGGVASNSIIRGVLEERLECRFAPAEFSADNAAGLAVLATMR